MANEEQLRILRQGVEAWNKWRAENPDVKADLISAYLNAANLNRANLNGADLGEADLSWADLSDASLCGADLSRAYLNRTDLRGVSLRGANLNGANLSYTYLSAADLSETSMVRTILVETKLNRCRIYGISAWNLKLEGSIQKDLVITDYLEHIITVDNLEVAQFIYLLLNNEKIRHTIDTITSKVVLILGRFTQERKSALDAVREELRKRDYLPVLFDFEKPATRDLTETISTLAHMARFVIADITDAKSIPAELERIVPDLHSVPIMPLILDSEYEYALFEHIRRYSWVLEPYRYENQGQLLATIEEKVIAPAEAKVEEIRKPGRQRMTYIYRFTKIGVKEGCSRGKQALAGPNKRCAELHLV